MDFQKNAPLLVAAALLLVAVLVIVALAQKPEPSGVKFAGVDDIKIAYRESGAGEPVILIMGFGGTMDLWDTKFLKELSSRYRVIIFDNRGMGLTSSSQKNYTMETLADDTVGLMDELGIRRAHVIGWSLGTYIAQELVLRHPEKVDRLVLYAADCGGKEAIMPSDEVLAKLADTSGTPEERNRQVFSLLFPKGWLVENSDPRAYFPDVTETSSAESIKRQNDAWMGWEGACNRLLEIKQPTLLIMGTDDILTPPENSRMMEKMIPNAKLVEIPGGGHGVMYQGGNLTVSVVDFLGG